MVHWRERMSSWTQDLTDDAVDELVKELARAAADITVTSMSPEKLHKWANSYRLKLGRFSRVFVPNKGMGWHAANEFVSDYFAELERSVKDGDIIVNHPERLEKDLAAGLKDTIGTVALIELALSQVDEPTRDCFTEWYESTKERRSKFRLLVANLNVDQIKEFVSKDPAQLDKLIADLPAGDTVLEFTRLRLEAAKDPELKKKIDDFLAKLNEEGPNQTVEFWEAIRKKVNRGSIRSIQDLRDLMELSDDEILKSLVMKNRTKSVWERYRDWRKTSVKDSKLVKWVEDLERKSEQFAKGPRGQRS